MMPLEVLTRSEDETIALGERLARVLRPGDVLALEGDLGAGKTRLVRGVARGLGIDERAVSSPTFVMVNVYDTKPDSSRAPCALVHIDAYRLTRDDDAESLGWDRLGMAESVLAIEWASRLGGPETWPVRAASVAQVRIEHVGVGGGADDVPGEGRRITIDAPASWMERQEWRVLAGGVTSKSHRCPACRAPVAEGAAHFPFDTERCRMADLGAWFSGSYSISRELREDDEPDTHGPGGTPGR
jgi:tRNA threonylcarbamoyladenosine biosynthesis protein TsaE